MTQSSPVARLSVEFDDFLYAPIGEDNNGMVLRVLSVLARSDLDPWQEAANLAGLPEKYATARLAALISALPGRASVPAGFGMIASRLIALLPRRSGSDAASPKVQAVAGVAPKSWAIMFVVFMALALGAQLITANNQPPAKADTAGAPVSTTVSPVAPSPFPGQ
jgi:hypothetical protein